MTDSPENHDELGTEDAPLRGELVVETEALLAVPPPPGSGEIGRKPVSVPATIAAATGGFVLGVAAFLMLKVLRQPATARKLSKRRTRQAAKRRGVEVVGSQSFLVDVHLIKR